MESSYLRRDDLIAGYYFNEKIEGSKVVLSAKDGVKLFKME